MYIHQFYDKGLAHASYGIINQGVMAVIDPARDPQPVYHLAAQHGANIVAVIETHPHADFISAHLEIQQQTGAKIYVSKLVGATYPHVGFDDGDSIELGDLRLKAINTPGHSPDSICILLEDEFGIAKAIFTGDTLFVGDVGRPDLREHAGNITAQKEELAIQMYQTIRHKLVNLPPDVVVYPAHGPGSLCGKNISPELQSTIGRELRDNYAMQLMDELTFVKTITADQPLIPQYFGYDVELNKQGAPAFGQSIAAVKILGPDATIDTNLPVIDTRPDTTFKQGHLPAAINLQDGEKFETWLGTLIAPDERFYLIAESDSALKTMIAKAAKIGYESHIEAALLNPKNANKVSAAYHNAGFAKHTEAYTIVDVRNVAEIEAHPGFANAIPIPLPQLRHRVKELPTNKPIVVHCAAGYRSAAASSIIEAHITNQPVYDMSTDITNWLK